MRTITLLLCLATGCYDGLALDDNGDTGSSTTDVGTEETGADPGAEEVALCQPGVLYTCYEGPPETRDVGMCAAGSRSCGASGGAFGPCEGMVLPIAERCDTAEDDDCDGSSACGGLEQIFALAGERLHDVAGARDRIVVAWSDATGAHLTSMSTIGGPERTIDLGVGLAPNDRLLLAYEEASGLVTLGATLTDTFVPAVDRPGECSASVGEGDVLLARFDADLVLATSRCWGDAAHQRLTSLDIPADGQPRIAGVFHGTMDFGGSVITAPDEHTLFFAQLDTTLAGAVWTNGFYAKSDSLELPSITASDDGAVVIGTGRDGPDSSGGSDVFVTSYGGDGDKRWTRWFGNSMDQVGRDVAALGGSLWISGESQGLLDLGDGPSSDTTTFQTFVARLDPATGAPLADQQFAGVSSSLARGRALAVDSTGDAILMGAASGPLVLAGQPLPGDGGHDIVLLRLGPTGSVRWSKRLGDAGEQVARAMQLDSLEHILLAGEFDGTLGDGGIHVQSNSSQLFALKFMP